jgi:hypothetical protein
MCRRFKGTTVWWSDSHGATNLVFWNWKRDKWSATTFVLPGICLALNKMLKCTAATTIRRTWDIKIGSLHDYLFITSTMAWLSERNKTLWFFIQCLHIWSVNLVGKSSLTAIWCCSKFFGYFWANHQRPKTAAYPTLPDASVYRL